MRLLGRDAELAALDAFLAAEDGPLALLVCGEPGIGKTALWTYAVHAASGYRVLAAQPADDERRLPYAGLADLLNAIDADLLAALPAPQRAALLGALGRADEAPSPRLVAAGLLAALRDLAAEEWVLVAIDGLPALDPQSASALRYAARRLDPRSFRLLATARTGWAGEVPPLLTDALPSDAVTLLRPRQLSDTETAQLLTERAGARPRRLLLERVHAAANGNPWLALELAADPSAVPARVRRTLPKVPSELREILLLTALAAGDLESVLSAAPDPAAARVALDEAEALGLITINQPSVRFVPPVAGLAIIATAPTRDRRTAHERLATLDTGVPVRHRALAAAGPDSDIAKALDEAAGGAAAALDFPVAAELAELAVSLTPGRDAETARGRRTIAAEHWFEAGDATRSRELLDEVVRDAGAWPGRAAALGKLATYQRYAGEPVDVWYATLRTALAAAPPDDVELQMDLLAQLGMAACNGGNAEDAPGYVDRMAEIARSHPEIVDAQLAAGIVYLQFLSGGGIRRDLLERALVPDPACARLPVEVRPTYTIAVALLHADELTAARDILDRDYAAAVQLRDDTGLPILAWQLVRLETWSGNWDRATQLAEQGRDAAERADSAAGRAFMAVATADLLACRGAVESARDEVARAVELAEQTGLVLIASLAAYALAGLELALGDAAAAEAASAQLPELALPTGLREPGMARGQPDRIEALVRLGRVDAAQALLQPFLANARSADRQWALVAGGRCEALVLSACGELAAAERVLDETLDRAAALGQPLEQGRTLLISGEVRRRARRKQLARDQLVAAKAVFDRLGATLWSQRCEIELGRATAGGAQPADSPLTATEVRVARLAAEGYTTREIANAVFAGARTVESHLQSIYRKLGVRSRVELSRRLGQLAANSADSTDSPRTGVS